MAGDTGDDAKDAAKDAAGDGRGQDVARFVEDFASTMTAAGMARMPSRVFACLLASEQGRLTAAELGERLAVSAGAVSSAVQYLDTVGLVRRSRQPGSRRDHYIVEHDTWYRATAMKDRVLDSWIERLGEGIAVVGAETGAGLRLAETREFFEFLRDEMAQLIDRWTARQQSRVDLTDAS